jgi:hypothetical protein
MALGRGRGGNGIRFLFALSSLDRLFVFVKFEVLRAIGPFLKERVVRLASGEECESGKKPTTGGITVTYWFHLLVIPCSDLLAYAKLNLQTTAPRD